MFDIAFHRPALVGREIPYIREAVGRGQLAGDGHFTRLCNQRIAELTGSPKALLTHSCTAALEMAAILCDLGPGDEVIMPSFSFVSTANAVVLRGAVPVFVDITPDTLNIDPVQVRNALSDRTKAIFVVHYAGFPADMDALTDCAKDAKCILVEDAAQALGSKYKGRPAGSLGDLAAFSFHETKNVIAGEGGALTLNRDDLFDRAEIIREKGTNRSEFKRGETEKYTWVDIGSSFLPGELIAAYLYAQLEVSGMINTRRLSLFDRYAEAFAPLETCGRLTLPKAPKNCTGNGHMFHLRLRDKSDRSAFIAHMTSNGIICPFHYVPLHDSPAGRRYAKAEGALDNTRAVSDTLVRLPMHFDLGSKIEDVINVATTFFEAPTSHQGTP